MKVKRDRLQVIHDILITMQNNAPHIKPTHIMYKANLSSQMLNEYLEELITQKLIQSVIVKEKKAYSLTKKGHLYLVEYSKVTKFLELFGL